jgi:hypothetical protein
MKASQSIKGPAYLKSGHSSYKVISNGCLLVKFDEKVFPNDNEDGPKPSTMIKIRSTMTDFMRTDQEVDKKLNELQDS